MDLVIRQVSENDLARCCFVESVCFPPEQAASCENIQKRIEQFPEGFLVAEIAGQIIGITNSGSTNQSDISNEAFKGMVGHESDGANIVIFSLAVLPEYQERGIARRLLHAFIERSGELGKQRVRLICMQSLVSYYEKSGFVDVGDSTSMHGGTRWREMHLTLNTSNS